MKRNRIALWGICLAAAVCALLLLSPRTSPLYPLLMGNYTGNDASAAMLIGKYWAAGELVPYRELFAMGGPLYFLIQAMGWALGGRGGILALQTLNLTAFLVLVWKTARHYVGGKASLALTLFTLIPYGAMCAGGGSSEEWCLTMSAAAVLLGLEWAGGKTSRLRLFLLGLLCGGVMMTDLGSMGICFGVLIAALVLSAPKKEHLWLSALAGMVLPAAAAYGYFAAMGCADAFWQGAVVYPAQALLLGFDSAAVVIHKCVKATLVLPALAASVLMLRRGRQDGLVLLGASLVCGVSMLLGNNVWCFYLAVLPLAAAGTAALVSCAKKRTVLTACAALALVLTICAVPAKNYAVYLRDGIPEVFQMFYDDAVQVRSEMGKSPAYLSLDTDASFFLALDTRPVNRYFADVATLVTFDSAIGSAVKADLDGAAEADFLLITERGFTGQSLDNYALTQVYLKLGGSVFVYLPY